MPPALRILALPLALLAATPATATGEAVEWLRSYLRIDTTNPPGNEHQAAGLLRRILHGEGLATELVVSAAGRANLMARLEAPEPAGGALVLLHHMDVVPPGDGWSRDPFDGDLGDEVVWGRGALDAKSLGIAHLAAFIDLARSGARLTRDVVFLAVADEESGGEDGVAWLLENRPQDLEGVAAVLNEGGHNRAYSGRLSWWGLEIAQKRPLWLRVVATGRGGHGSVLNLHTAPHRLVRALSAILDRPLDLRVTEEARAYFAAVEPLESRAFREMVADLDQIVEEAEPGRRLLPGIPSYLADSIQINVLEAGSRINTAPQRAEARIDIRLLPDTDAEALLEELRARVGRDAEIEVLLSSPPAAPSPTEHPVYSCVSEVLAPTAPVIPAFIPGVTDSRHFRLRGIPAYGFSPFVLDSLELRGIHGVDERIPVAAFEDGVQTMKRVVRACATG